MRQSITFGRIAGIPIGASWTWLPVFVLIVWSTLAVKQHVWWDVAAGLLLAVAAAVPSLHWRGSAHRGDIMTS
jgi:membrane-associated phospholipid phosphatase